MTNHPVPNFRIMRLLHLWAKLDLLDWTWVSPFTLLFISTQGNPYIWRYKVLENIFYEKVSPNMVRKLFYIQMPEANQSSHHPYIHHSSLIKEVLQEMVTQIWGLPIVVLPISYFNITDELTLLSMMPDLLFLYPRPMESQVRNEHCPWTLPYQKIWAFKEHDSYPEKNMSQLSNLQK